MSVAARHGFIFGFFLPKQLPVSPLHCFHHTQTLTQQPKAGKFKGRRFWAMLQVLACLQEGCSDDGVDSDFRRPRFSLVTL